MSSHDAANSSEKNGSASNTDPTYIQALTTAIETVVNSALKYDPASRQKIAALQDILAVKITVPSLCFYIQGQEEGVRVFSYCESPISTHLTGSPIALLSLLQQPSNLNHSGVSITGSTQLLQQWQDILQTLDIDWEDAISQVFGDIAGPLSASGLRQSATYAKTQLKEQGRLIAEYLPEELKVTPSKPEAEAFFEQVDQLKLHIDRLSARIQALQSQVNAAQTKTNDDPSKETP